MNFVNVGRSIEIWDAYILPIFLQKRHEEVHEHLRILEELLLLHTQLPTTTPEKYARNVNEIEQKVEHEDSIKWKWTAEGENTTKSAY